MGYDKVSKRYREIIFFMRILFSYVLCHIPTIAASTSNTKKYTNSIGDYLPQQSTNDDNDCGSAACVHQ